MKARVCTHLPGHSSALMPALAMAAPAYPPIRACEDDDGNPAYHVIRFQLMAPSRLARTTVASTTPMSTSSFPIGLATAVPNTNTAMKLKQPAQTTAAVGDSTRVETTVAIEFAASWNPLLKSKISATRMIAHTNQALWLITRVSA